MNAKRILLIVPLILGAVLIQSYFWVPSYETQARGNPQRLFKFIEASIGDAKILNPILHADTASGRIVDLVFDGLLDYDENLVLRPALAVAWAVSEYVYLLPNPDVRLPGGGTADAANIAAVVSAALATGQWSDLRESVSDVEVMAPMRHVEHIVDSSNDTGRIDDVVLQMPAQVRLSLDRVRPDIGARLRSVLGEDYFRTPQYLQWVVEANGVDSQRLQSHLSEMLPLIQHNPLIVFQLRRGVRFHDGHEFDAGDVKFTYDAIMDPKNLSPRTSDFEPVKAVNVVDRYTVEVVYKRLFSPAVNAWTMGILPEHLLNRSAQELEIERRGLSAVTREAFGLRDSEFNRAPVGTGSFAFVEWQSDEVIQLRANERYWDGAPQFENYYFRILPDPLTQEVEFRTGAIDIYRPEPHQIARYKQESAYQSFSGLGRNYTYIGYNNRKPLFSDPQVRKALSMAINIDDIIHYVLYGEGEAITGPYPKTTPWYDHDIAALGYDPDTALRLLQEAGWQHNADGWLEKDGREFEFNLITNNGNLVRKAVLTIAQDAWRKIGIKCTTQVFEWAVFLKDFINPGAFDAVILGWSMGADADLYQLWHSSESGFGQLNFVGYNNADADNLIERIRREYDTDEQQRLAHRLHRQIAEDQPYTFLYAKSATTVLDKKIAMRNAVGQFVSIPPTKSGDTFYYFNRWRKLEHALQ
ncbi:MAG: ABC transporter substrate-binding protein [Gammaproteobacteria bacterium]|nr:ABC transporter substrate-binding protein [Gammaproteobacteria bacterium]MDH3466041.1 ABC transporter substrate-binding protein [Gammaproteobacteria bacterium]